MRAIEILAMGTYNPWHQRGRDGPNAHEMRGLVWYFKDNQPGKVTDTFWLAHQGHGSRYNIGIASPSGARDYVAQVLGKPLQQWAPATLIPIPASHTTLATINDRWPAMELAQRLERRGLGEVRPCIVNVTATESKKGKLGKMRDLIANTQILAYPPDDGRVVFIDDVATSGEHVAAADVALRLQSRARACVAAISQGPSEEPRRAYDYRLHKIEYEQDLMTGSWICGLR